jgi:hypothetical protein
MKANNQSELIVYDLAVIGSGPAGMILALEFAELNPDKSVALIEFGSRNQEGSNFLDDSISISNPINHYGPYDCTNKGLGGTSRTWGGRCVMFDEVDFEPREIIGNHCTWKPDLLEELYKYTSKTSAYFECGSDVFDCDNLSNAKYKRIAENFLPGVVTDSRLERWSMPTRFGSRYEKIVDTSSVITVFEDCQVVGFKMSGDKVDSIVVSDKLKNRQFDLKAKKIALTAGTQESTRLLLKNTQIFDALGFIPDALGKYYQSHISGKIASIKFFGKPELTDYEFQIDANGTYVRRRFQFTKDFLVSKNLLNIAFWLDNPLYHNPSHKNGAMSFMYLAMITPFLGKKLAPPAIKHSVTKGKVNGLHLHFWNLLCDFPKSLWTPFNIFYKRYIPKRKLPGVFLYNKQNTYALHFHSEQIPDPRNRMYLSEDGNSLIIDYNVLDEDVKSIIQLHKELDGYLQSIKCGKLEYWYPENELEDAIRVNSKDGIHQSGTTRMADSASEGVVDLNLKVFGTQNLYICSCSVFPTSSQANPTYFIGAFAVRMAHHLSQ